MLADSVANSLGHNSVAWQLCQLCSTLLQRPLHFIHSVPQEAILAVQVCWLKALRIGILCAEGLPGL